MPKEVLEIVMTANNQAALASLKQTAAGIEGVSIVAQKTTAKMGDLAKGSNQAGQALTNVGRVAQDLPFGFMGIQNNLNPLLESFQRLKVETGSTGGALKALAGSLMGAGGVGLALSVVSSAFLIFQNGIAGFNKKTTEAKEKLDKLTESLNQNREAATKDISIMQAYVAASKNTALSTDQRQIAVDKLIQDYPAYFKGLTVENALTKDITQSTNALTDAIYKRAAARAIEGDIAAKATQVFREQEKSDKIKLDIDKARLDLAKQQKTPTQIGGGGTLGGLSAGTTNTAELAAQNLNNLLKKDKELNDGILKIKNEITKAQEKVNKLTAGQINLDAKLVKGKVEKVNTLTPADISKQAAVTDARATQDLVSAVDSNRLLIQAQNESLDRLRAEQAKNSVAKSLMAGGLNDPLAAQKSGELANYDMTQQANAQTLLGLEQSRKEALNEINIKLLEQQALAQSIGDSFANVFSAVINAKDPFEALTQSVKQLVIDLGIAAVKMFLIRTIAYALNPVSGAATGIGAILGKITGGGYAGGGVSSGPQSGHMELLHGTEAILTPAQMSGLVRNSMNAGAVSSMGTNTQQQSNQNGEFVLRGNDLVLALQRSNVALNLRRGS